MPVVSTRKPEQTQEFHRDSDYDGHLPLTLGLGLLVGTVSFLFVGLLFIICQRLRKYRGMLTENDDGYTALDDNEHIQFDKEKLHLTTVPGTTGESSSKPGYVSTDTTAQKRVLFEAFSIGDEDDQLSDVENNKLAVRPVKSHHVKVEPITIMTSVTVVPQQTPELPPPLPTVEDQMHREAEPLDSNTCNEGQHRSYEENKLELNFPKQEIRRISSTPNLKYLEATETASAYPALPNVLPEQMSKKQSPPLDDTELFTGGCTEEDLEMVNEDGTLVDSTEHSAIHVSGSVGDIGSIRPLLPIRLPPWALATGKPESGFLVFSLSINQKPGCDSPRFLLDVRVLEARCVLSRNVEPRAGKFYVKARIQPDGSKDTFSIYSLDQLNRKPRSIFSDGSHQSVSLGRKGTISVGSTPVRRAYRSPVFWHAITLETALPNYMFNDESQMVARFGNSLYTEKLETQRLELKLDLKERNALKSDGLYGSNSSLLLPAWKQSQLLGSVRIPLDHRMWNYFLRASEDIQCSPLRRSTLIDRSDEELANDRTEQEIQTRNKRRALAVEPRVLRFVRKLEVPSEDAIDRGDLTIGLQYNNENAKLTLNPLKCSAIHLPKGTSECVNKLLRSGVFYPDKNGKK
ncbi:unnamed protein product [Dicrocoelium dendriticum]|nr:unnamed protein product [Dicrocoelium dendriticum]